MTATPTRTRELLDSIAVPVIRTDTDRRFATLVRAHFEDLLRREPVYATYLGIHELDDRPNAVAAVVVEVSANDRSFEIKAELHSN